MMTDDEMKAILERWGAERDIIDLVAEVQRLKEIERLYKLAQSSFNEALDETMRSLGMVKP